VFSGARGGASVNGMTSIRLTILALAILAASAVAGIAAYATGVVDPGFTYGFSHDDAGRQTLVIASVRPGGLAWYEGVEPGFIVLSLEGALNGGGVGEQLYTPPGAVEAQQAAAATLPGLVFMAKPGELLSPLPPGYLGTQIFESDWAASRLESSASALIAGALLCLAGLLWLGFCRLARRPALGVEAPLLAAAASPLFLLPAYLTLSPLLVVLTSVLVAAAALTAAAALAQLIATPRARRRAMLCSTVLALAALLVGAVAATAGMERGVLSILRWALASAVPLVPALVLAAQLRRDAGRLAGSSRLATVLRAGDIAVLATLPAVALAPLAALTSRPFLQPLVVWFVVVGITRVVAVLPVAREAAREARDRSLVVDEGESERARIAADIHDDVIQDLSMLVHRLDRAGEDDAAATLRGAIDRLRAICADLRLPVIHDLGLAAALEALVGEVRATSGIAIDLRYDREARLPYDVELGLYRIAQEAVANAIKHGRPPITVRLRAEPGSAELEVEDRGSGVGEDALARPASPGHLGFLTMAQRAAKLGAELAVADRPEGGTRVRVVWSGAAASQPAEGARAAAT
jgi:signal transduction histidine kinase